MYASYMKKGLIFSGYIFGTNWSSITNISSGVGE